MHSTLSATTTNDAKHMYFKQELRETDLPEILCKFIKIAGRERWKKRLEWLKREVDKETGMSNFWIERCSLELAFLRIWQQHRKNRNILVDTADHSEILFLSFAAMTVYCHQRLLPTGRKRLEGMLRRSTTNDNGLAPVQYEMRIASHLMRRNYDVEFQDLEGRQRYDLLGVKDGMGVEIECKYMSGDAGRKIHRKEFYRFCDSVYDSLRSHLEKLMAGVFAQITIPKRLEPTDDSQNKLLAILRRALVSGNAESEEGGIRVRVQNFDVEDAIGPWTTADYGGRIDLKIRLWRHFNLVNKNAMIYVRPRRGILVLLVQSSQTDDVIGKMLKELRKDTISQFTRDHPGILCCHLAELAQGQLRSAAQTGGNRLYELATGIMHRRPHLYSVTYTASGSTRLSSSGHVEETGLAFTVLNSSHPNAGDERLSVFGEGLQTDT